MSQALLSKIADEGIEYVDIRFTDPRGKLQHVTVCADQVDQDFLDEGFMFDGSSIAGWKSIEESDMKLMPDVDSAYVDPFYAEKTICIHCTVVEPDTGESYARDPRGCAQRAEAYLKSSGIGDVAYMGPEAEFFLFDDVRFENKINKVSYEVDAVDASWNTDSDYEVGNMGHRPGVKGGYFPVNPIDDAQDIRSEMLSTMKRMGMKVDKHHHEVASCQHELGLIFGSLTHQADELQKYKYVIHNVAHAYGKSATFMPKPIAGDNGTGMHVNMSIWKDGKPLFAGDKYADLSDEALYFIGGILQHAKALNAFTNPSTNSYKRLIPGFESRKVTFSRRPQFTFVGMVQFGKDKIDVFQGAGGFEHARKPIQLVVPIVRRIGVESHEPNVAVILVPPMFFVACTAVFWQVEILEIVGGVDLVVAQNGIEGDLRKEIV